MRLLERIGSAWAALRSKSAPPAGSYSYGWGGGSLWSDAFKFRRAPSPSELADAYKSIVYACVNLNANAVARTPLRLYAITKGGQARPKCAVSGVSRKTHERLKGLDYAAKTVAGAERVEEVTAHPLLDVVRKVNEDLDHTQLITYTAMSLDIVGTAYWWPSPGRLGLPEELWALPPHLVFPVFTSGTMVPDAYNFGGEIYPKDQLIRFRRLSAKNPYGQGYGPEQAAIEYARLEDTFVSLQDDLLSNGPRPSVIVSHKDPRGAFGPAERQRLEADMERRGRGGRAGGVFVVDGAATVTPISYSPTDLGALNVSSYDVERIANCFDVPVSMLKTEDVNRANAEAGQAQHGRNAVEPRCRLIASTLTRWTHSLDGRGRMGYDRLFWAFDPVVAEDKAAEAELHKTYVDLGVLTRNEVRLELGYEPIAEGDTLLIPGSLKPLSEVVSNSNGQDSKNESLPSSNDDVVESEEDRNIDSEKCRNANDSRNKSVRSPTPSFSPWDEGWGGRSWGARLVGSAYGWDAELFDDFETKWNPCRDARGRFAPCGGRARRAAKKRRRRNSKPTDSLGSNTSKPTDSLGSNTSKPTHDQSGLPPRADGKRTGSHGIVVPASSLRGGDVSSVRAHAAGIAQFRARAGLPAVVASNKKTGTVARAVLEDGRVYHGVNSSLSRASVASRMKVVYDLQRSGYYMKVRNVGHAPMLAHAEAHALIRAVKRGGAKRVTLYADRRLCKACRNQLGLLAEYLKIEKLYLIDVDYPNAYHIRAFTFKTKGWL